MNEKKKPIYDIGAHTGDDTAYYLQRGYNVVAVEANPFLVKQLKQRFTGYIANKRLVLLQAAITDQPGDEIQFFVCSQSGESSLYPGRIQEAGWAYEKIKVPACRLSNLFMIYGKGHYCKMDIEGGDIPVLKTLNVTDELPDYFSIEISCLSIQQLIIQQSEIYEALEEFQRLGYTKFKLVDQYTLATLTLKPFYFRQRTLIMRLKRRLFGLFDISTPSLNTRNWYSRKLAYQFTTDSSGAFADDISGGWEMAEKMREIITERFSEFYEFEKKKGPHIFWVDLHSSK